MTKARVLASILVMLIMICVTSLVTQANPPSCFDLRDVAGYNYVTSIKHQQGGTCWAHGTMASMEGNLLMTGVWTAAGESGEPDLAEYHLDWWNGFNQHNNDDLDPPVGSGLIVHEGGDYRVAAAYLSRGEGAVRDVDGQSFSSPPVRSDSNYHYFYARDIEWLTAGADLSNINTIKHKIMTEGVLGTCMFYSDGFIENNIHYQPPASSHEPNHAIGIVGWDDTLITGAQNPGAWLCKNSWGVEWGLDGYFWISYYDKHCCQHPQMGAISFSGIEPMPYDHIYYHDYHGWRNTRTDITTAFNAFNARSGVGGIEELRAVSFNTAADSVDYTVTVYDRFEGGQLLDELAIISGTIDYTGFHTIDLDTPICLMAGGDFYICVELSDGGHPYDQTSDVPVLLGAKYRTIVESSAAPNQSFYRSGSDWIDLYEDDTTANFCIKGLCKVMPYLTINFPGNLPEFLDPDTATAFNVQIIDGSESYLPGSGTLHYRFDGGEFLTSSLTSLGDDLYEAVLPAADCDAIPEFYVSAEGQSKSQVFSPPDAPNTVYSAVVGWPGLAIQDNFETDQGWTTEILGATGGYWMRGVPIDDPDWAYDPASDADGSGRCYLTENHYGNSDVDDGMVRLTSPTFDMSRGGIISYDYYLYLTDASGVDRIMVEISNSGGSGMWYMVAWHDTNGGTGWRSHEITPADLAASGVTPTATMKIRFTANDWEPQSIVEAGIDNFVVTSIDCEMPYLCGDANGDSEINLLDILYLIAHLYGVPPGDPPDPIEAGDPNADHDCDLLDILYLIDHLYGNPQGPEPECP
ncbi:MAG: hypothetical protein JSV44_00380 [Candidatus Zixiibacteriota bacterium]|nr:MAG: hypothetical protein JSV44_00380 [candidate division Zixibacteria bacterium]